MTTDHLILLSMPGLRVKDVNELSMPNLHSWAAGGALARLQPTFPCVTSPVQASMLTGTGPSEHGVIANGFFHRDRNEVEFWTAHHDVVAGEPVWDAIRKSCPDWTTAVWHAQNIKGAAADYIVTPSPIHHPDGRTELWCYSKPEGLYQELLDELGHFPLQHYWGPLANIESTRWTFRAAARLAERHHPNFQFVYVPHLDYAAQKFGPDSAQARAALTELDGELAEFVDRITSIEKDVAFLAVGEYALTAVNNAIFLNRILREQGLLSVRQEEGVEQVDIASSQAFAMVDHQFAHVYLRPQEGSNQELAERIAGRLRSVDGIEGIYVGDERKEIGIDHERSGEIVLVAREDSWFAYYWWLDDRLAPPFARTVDIHRKPGYDPCEMFIDPGTRGIPLVTSLVNGSHGAPALSERQQTALLCSQPSSAIRGDVLYSDTQIKSICLSLLGLT